MNLEVESLKKKAVDNGNAHEIKKNEMRKRKSPTDFSVNEM